MKELVEIAILAYRGDRYRDAIELLLQVIEHDADNWFAALYLGLAYKNVGRTSDAHRVLRRLAIACPDEHIRFKSQNTLSALDAETRRRFKETATTPIDVNYGDPVISLG